MALNLIGFEQVNRVILLPIELIDPNPNQPRRNFDPRLIRELADSIAENGLLTPISVRKIERRFELIAGERRLLAFQLLGENKIPAIVEKMDERHSAVLALVENLQRKELDFYEEAEAMSALIKSYGLTQQQVADRLGIAQSTVANKLRLLRIDSEVIRKLIDKGLTERHARALLPLAEDARLTAAAEQVVRRQLNVAQTERYVAELLSRQKNQGSRLLILKDLRIFSTTINRAVDVMKQAGIEVDSRKTEDEETITYTITIPKAPLATSLVPKASISS